MTVEEKLTSSFKTLQFHFYFIYGALRSEHEHEHDA